MWGMARGLGIIGKNSRIKDLQGFVMLELDTGLSPAAESFDISMPLPGSGTVAFLLSKLPRELQEALKHENLSN